jgi:uncharacterized protein YfaQ (DUF2300 family)
LDSSSTLYISELTTMFHAHRVCLPLKLRIGGFESWSTGATRAWVAGSG